MLLIKQHLFILGSSSNNLGPANDLYEHTLGTGAPELKTRGSLKNYFFKFFFICVQHNIQGQTNKHLTVYTPPLAGMVGAPEGGFL